MILQLKICYKNGKMLKYAQIITCYIIIHIFNLTFVKHFYYLAYNTIDY